MRAFNHLNDIIHYSPEANLSFFVLLLMQDASDQPLSLGSGFFAAEGVVVENAERLGQ